MPYRVSRSHRAALALCAGALASAALLTSCASARVDLPSAAPAAGDPTAAADDAEITGPVDPDDTGVPEGVVLKESGDLRITERGAVVDGLDVKGCVSVMADDVTIRNTQIRCTTPGRVLAVEVGKGIEGLVIEQSEIDGGGVVEIGVGWTRYTLRRVNIHGVVDGARFGHGVTVEESWIHDMARIKTLHPDALQTTSASDVVIRGNVLDPTRSKKDGDDDVNNAGLQMGSETGTKKVRDVLVEHNRFDGGNYSLNISSAIDAEGVVIQDNVFGDDARYGAVLAPKSVSLGEGNITEGSGQPVKAERAD